ncbi:hypothetical protein P9112_011044 [Eukaryota sp. TZLM1-RC]
MTIEDIIHQRQCSPTLPKLPLLSPKTSSLLPYVPSSARFQSIKSRYLSPRTPRTSHSNQQSPSHKHALSTPRSKPFRRKSFANRNPGEALHLQQTFETISDTISTLSNLVDTNSQKSLQITSSAHDATSYDGDLSILSPYFYKWIHLFNYYSDLIKDFQLIIKFINFKSSVFCKWRSLIKPPNFGSNFDNDSVKDDMSSLLTNHDLPTKISDRSVFVHFQMLNLESFISQQFFKIMKLYFSHWQQLTSDSKQNKRGLLSRSEQRFKKIKDDVIQSQQVNQTMFTSFYDRSPAVSGPLVLAGQALNELNCRYFDLNNEKFQHNSLLNWRCYFDNLVIFRKFSIIKRNNFQYLKKRHFSTWSLVFKKKLNNDNNLEKAKIPITNSIIELKYLQSKKKMFNKILREFFGGWANVVFDKKKFSRGISTALHSVEISTQTGNFENFEESQVVQQLTICKTIIKKFIRFFGREFVIKSIFDGNFGQLSQVDQLCHEEPPTKLNLSDLIADVNKVFD